MAHIFRHIMVLILLIVLFFCSNASAEEKTALLDMNGLKWDEIPQYLYNYDYNLSEVNITYETCANTFKGRLIGRNLKPNFTYQMKIFGKPCCYYSQRCNNESNEKIGYLGRWWDMNKSGANKNINDNEYEDNKEIHCIFGYIVFDYFTTNPDGDIVKDFECNSSYHVLWCNCAGEINNHDLIDGLCPECAIGEPEAGRATPSTLVMPEGDYNVRFTLTEECFHQGWNWSSVLSNDSIEFTIVRPVICGDVDGVPGVTMSDGRKIFMNIIHGSEQYPLSNPWAADCDGVPGVTMSDGRQIFMNIIHGSEEYPLTCG